MGILKPVRTVSLKDRAVSAIRDAIFSGQLGPGDPLRELHLAKELQVSQPTVREALMELERHGLVVRRPNIETTVTNMTASEIRDRLELRTMLEQAALRKAVPHLTPANYAELEDAVSHMARAVATNNYHDIAQADYTFHHLIWSRCGNMALLHGLECLTTPLFAFVSIMRSAWWHDLSRIADGHRHLLEVLRGGDLALIDETIAVHINQSYLQFLESTAKDCRGYLAQMKTETRPQSAAATT
ncbi:MAG: GntR family transcriptional regulator [Bryobacterales bacterium]|nr:GntR family transcriptional regulator [Bryobacterales bacterium]